MNNNVLDINSKNFSKQISSMKFEEIYNLLSKFMDLNYNNYIKSIISLETGIDDINTLENLYDSYMKNDHYSLINDDLIQLIKAKL